MKLCITISKYHSWYLCQISLQIMLLPIQIHWGNVFKHSCIQRHKIQRKSYPWSQDTFQTNGNLPAHTFRALSPTDLSKKKPLALSNVWGKYFKLKKKNLMVGGYQHNLKEKLLTQINKTPRNWNSALLKQNSKEEKEMLPFVTQCQPLGSIIKDALMEK